MHRLDSEADLIQTFRPRDRKNVIVPVGTPFPLIVRYYHAWTEPSGVRVYVVFKKPGWKAAIGVAFRRDQQGSATSPARMCEWCHAMGPSDQIGLLTASVDAKTRVGVNACLDLGCLEKLETQAQLSGQDFSRLAEKQRERMARFCTDALGIRGA